MSRDVLVVVIFASAKAGPVCILIMCASFVGFGTTEDVISLVIVCFATYARESVWKLVLACVGEDAQKANAFYVNTCVKIWRNRYALLRLLQGR